jgi:hypothetical protein
MSLRSQRECMCKEILVFMLNRAVDTKRIIRKNGGRGEGEIPTSASLTQKEALAASNRWFLKTGSSAYKTIV